jgi:Carboxypeptidase regulatory-like domain/TonB dependent receptor
MAHRFRIWTAFTGFVWAVFLGCGANLNAQLATATLSGVVRDPSTAAVPGAQVTLESTLEQASRRTVTDSAGAYVIPAILPGSYRLAVRAEGFEAQTVTNIVLAAGQGSTLNVTLTLAKAVTRVEVKQAPPLLQTTTATVGSEITGTEFVALPLLGRSFQSLLEFLPGVAYTPSGAYNFSIGGGGYGSTGASNNPSVYGLRNRDNDYTIDGVPNDQVSYNGVPIYPPPETIAEMKVETGTDSGAQGWAAGASIVLVTKSGTNQYHGDAWEYLQNNALNARSYFEPSLGPYKYNQFGGAVGGPLVIPHLISKEERWYFFGWYEGVRIHSAANFEGLVPTAAERQGDFSQGSDASTPIYNPYTSVLNPDGSLASRQLFPENIIPSNLLNPTALEIDKLLYPLPNLAPGVIPGVNYFNTGANAYTYDQYSGRVDHQFRQNDNFYARITEARNPSLSIGLPALPSGMTNNFINLAVSDTHTVSPTFIVTARFGMQRTNPEYFGGWPSKGGPDVLKLANMTGFAPYEGRIDLMPPLTIGDYTGLSQYGGSDGPEFLYSWTVDAQKIKGRHTLAFGGRIMHNSFFTDCQTGTFEDFAAAQTGFGSGTGNPLASYLLGLPASAGRLAGHTAGDDTGDMYSLYVQDNFRASPKLTLNLGLRWDYETPFINSFGGSTFQWETGQMLWDITNPVTGAPANARRGLVAPDYRGYQPRFGIAYSITPKTVVRSSFGIFSDGLGNTAQDEESNHGNWPFALSQTEGSLNLGLPTELMADPFPGPLVSTSVPEGLAQGENSYTPTSRTGYVYEWSASVQRQLTPSIMFEASYVGNRGLKLTSQIVDNTALYPGTDPYEDRQRWPNFPPYVENNYDENSSLYDGLSLRLDKRFSRNLSFLVDFTWGKALDTEDGIGEGLSDTNATGEGGVDSTRFNLGQFWGDAGFDIEKVFNATYIYDIPFKTQSKWANAMLANWELSGDVSADSGLPYFVFIDGDNENIGYVGRYDELPNLVGNPNTIAKRTDVEWFNTAAYQMPVFGTAGNANRSTNPFSDPLFNWDSAFIKRWPFGENKSFEFRAEFFNIFNLSTFAPPASLVNDPNFGVVNSSRQNGREIQFALKFHF